MGSTFSNISVKKNKDIYTNDDIKNSLVLLMDKKGYKLAEHSSKYDITFYVKVDPNTNWITIYSDEYDGDLLAMNSYGTNFSKIFQSPVLCVYCKDSDFLLLT